MPMKKQTRREFVKTLGLGVSAATIAGVTGFASCNGEKKRPPNIVLIFTDDQGFADVGCYGAQGFETPNLDKMAEEGMRFTNFYVSQAVCSASRASLLTGCYAERVGIQGALSARSNIGLNPEEETIAEVLKKKGYATGIFGKWHLGRHKKFLPLQQGFDEYFGLPYSNDMWPYDYHGNPAKKGRKAYNPPLFLIDGNEKAAEVKSLEDQAKLTTLYTERAVKFIEKNKDKPFFLYLPHSMPHTPLGVSEKFLGKSKQGKYGDVIMEIDWSVGEILKTLKKFGLDENTLVIFTSDNGPWLNFGNHAGSVGPLREGKGTAWEGGVRVPCIMRWPGHIPEGKVCDKIAATIDILPTLAKIAGAPLPKKKIDGVNILPLMKGEENANPRDHFFYYYGGELRAVRQGRWKLVFPHKYRSYEGVEPGNDGTPGRYNFKTCGLELYDLESDAGETKNVIAEHPGIVKKLQALAEKAREDLGDRLQNKNGKGVREPGRFHTEKIKKVNHLAVGKKIELKYAFARRYAGGGKNGLINGLKGTSDYNDGIWQGFEGVDLIATIDLGKTQHVKEISCGFLQNQVSWIFFPREVEFAVSTDGKQFEILKQIVDKSAGKELDPEAKIKEISAKFELHACRYVRIIAKNLSICPDWHPGAGGKAWIFADEIVVR